MKKIVIILFTLLVVLIGMAYLYFSKLNTANGENDLALNAASTSSGIIFSFDNDKSFYDILEGQTIFQDILGKEKTKTFTAIKTHLLTAPAINNLIKNQKIYLSFTAGAKNNINFLVSALIKKDIDAKNIIAILNNNNVPTITLGQINRIIVADSTVLYLAVKQGLILLSNNLLPIKEVLKQNKPDKNFVSYIKKNNIFSKNTLANLYLNFNNLTPLLKTIIVGKPNGEVTPLTTKNTYAALVYNFSAQKLLFSGNISVENLNSYYKLFDELAEQKIFINTILTAETANYTIFAIPSYLPWQKELNLWFKANKQQDLVNKKIAAVNEQYHLNLNQIFPKYYKNQMVTFQLQSGEKLGAIALTNGTKVNQLLIEISADFNADIKIFKEENLLYCYFGEPFKKFNRPYYTILDNYMIVANNANTLQNFLNNYRSGKLLIQSENYINVIDQFSSSANISFYVNNKNSANIFNNNLFMPFYKLSQAKNGLKNYNAFCCQLSGDKGKFLTNLLLYKNSKQVILDTLANKIVK